MNELLVTGVCHKFTFLGSVHRQVHRIFLWHKPNYLGYIPMKPTTPVHHLSIFIIRSTAGGRPLHQFSTEVCSELSFAILF